MTASLAMSRTRDLGGGIGGGYNSMAMSGMSMSRTQDLMNFNASKSVGFEARRERALTKEHIDELMYGPQISVFKGKSLRFQSTTNLDDVEENQGPASVRLRGWSSRRIKLKSIVESSKFETFFGFVILANFTIIVFETDARARMQEDPSQKDVLDGLERCNLFFLVCYILESGMRFFVQRCSFFRHGWNVFDAFLLICGIAGEILNALIQASDGLMGNMNLLRSMRMIRLLRLSRVLISFPGLYGLLCGLANCFSTLAWAAGLMFMTLTVFSIVAVEYIHPLMEPLQEQGNYNDCFWCPGAFRSIMHSNLTFFQICSGDGWSTVARALIEAHPWTGLIFVSVIFIVLFGLLNLVVAAIVDTAARAREEDIMNLAVRKEKLRDGAWKRFTDIVNDLDKDNSGDISRDELGDGIESIPELRAYLSVMHITDDELTRLFDFLDTDNNGILTLEEFATELYNIQTQEPNTAMYYVRRACEEIRKNVKTSCDKIDLLSRQQRIEESTNISDHVNSILIRNSQNQSVLEEVPEDSGTSDLGRASVISVDIQQLSTTNPTPPQKVGTPPVHQDHSLLEERLSAPSLLALETADESHDRADNVFAMKQQNVTCNEERVTYDKLLPSPYRKAGGCCLSPSLPCPVNPEGQAQSIDISHDHPYQLPAPSEASMASQAKPL